MMKIVLRLAGRRDSVNMAREGLRTLIMARKRLGYTTYSDLANIYHAASIRLEGRNEAMSVVVAQFWNRSCLDSDWRVRRTSCKMMSSRHWSCWGMLEWRFGCWPRIGLRLLVFHQVGYEESIHTWDVEKYVLFLPIRYLIWLNFFFVPCLIDSSVQTADQARDQLEFLQIKLDCCLIIDGNSLQVGSFLKKTWYLLLTRMCSSSSYVSTFLRTSLLLKLLLNSPLSSHVAHTESRCCATDSELYAKTSVLYRRWW
jgi:phospholipid-translocating ATPase